MKWICRAYSFRDMEVAEQMERTLSVTLFLALLGEENIDEYRDLYHRSQTLLAVMEPLDLNELMQGFGDAPEGL